MNRLAFLGLLLLVSILPAFGQQSHGPYKVAIADMNGDECVDLVLGYQGAGVITVEQGDCEGGFRRLAANVFETDEAVGDRHVHNLSLFDVDADGDLDIAAAIGGMDIAHPGAVVIAENVGNGALVERVRVMVPSQAKGVALGDFDGDGRIDLAATAAGRGNAGDLETGRLYLWPGKGGFSVCDPIHVETGHVAYSNDVADADGNGTPDFLVPNAHTDFVSLVFNPGATLFSAGPRVTALFMPRPPGYDVPRLNDAKFADVNGDGVVDVIAVSTNGGFVGSWWGMGGGEFAAPRVLAVGEPYAAFIAVCDVNEDGYADIAATHYMKLERTSILVGSAGGLLPPQSYATATGSYGIACGHIDDGDQAIDLVTANYAAHSISILRGLGDGTFAGPVHQDAGIVWRNGSWTAQQAEGETP